MKKFLFLFANGLSCVDTSFFSNFRLLGPYASRPKPVFFLSINLDLELLTNYYLYYFTIIIILFFGYIVYSFNALEYSSTSFFNLF